MTTDNTATVQEIETEEEIEIDIEVEDETETVTFSSLGVDPIITETLAKKKIITPTPIQERAIPIALEGRDVVGIAQTGTGKTLAFALPTIQKLLSDNSKALVLVPTRELALQVAESVSDATDDIEPPFRGAVLIGGASMSAQIQQLSRKPRFIIATPGRLADHLERRTLTLSDVSVVILDEADRMFDMGFAPQIKRVLEVTPKSRQTLLFSATMPPEIQAIADRHQKDPVRIQVTPPGETVKAIKQEVCYVQQDAKLDVLEKLLKAQDGLTLIFAKTKHGVKNLTKKIRGLGIRAEEMHSNRSMFQRKKALEDFKSAKCPILVATDVAARGIDVENIRLVVNYDLPQSPEDYVHRIGRTGRAGRTGNAISFAAPSESFKIRAIERISKSELGLSEHSSTKPAPRREGRSNESREGGRDRPQRSNFRGGRSNDRGGRSEYRGARSEERSPRGEPRAERSSEAHEVSAPRTRSERAANPSHLESAPSTSSFSWANNRSSENRTDDRKPREESRPAREGTSQAADSRQPRAHTARSNFRGDNRGGPRADNRSGGRSQSSRGGFGGGNTASRGSEDRRPRGEANGNSVEGSHSPRAEVRSQSKGSYQGDSRGPRSGGSSYGNRDSRPGRGSGTRSGGRPPFRGNRSSSSRSGGQSSSRPSSRD